MIRLFTGLSLPDSIRTNLVGLMAGLPGATWSTFENLHITLSFIGEVEEPTLDPLIDSLANVRAAPFSLSLAGLSHFGSRKPRLLYVPVRGEPGLEQLQARGASAIRRMGLTLEDRAFVPHVTLARLKVTPLDRLMQREAECGLFATAPFEVTKFHLFQSLSGKSGPVYRPLVDFTLAHDP